MLRWCSVNCGDAKCMHRTNRANNMKTHLSRLVESKQISTLQPNKKTLHKNQYNCNDFCQLLA